MKTILTAALLLFTLTVTSAYQAAQTATLDAAAAAKQEEELAQAGEKLVDRVCGECHAVDEITAVRRTQKSWEEMVMSMSDRGASATEDEFKTINRYLARYYGSVRVNSATADELSAVLGLTAAQAAAIVAHRTASGRITDAAALMKVPGVDAAKLEEQPQALRFD